MLDNQLNSTAAGIWTHPCVIQGKTSKCFVNMENFNKCSWSDKRCQKIKIYSTNCVGIKFLEVIPNLYSKPNGREFDSI